MRRNREDRAYLTVEDVAAMYGCSPHTVRNLITSAQLPAYRIGSKLIRVKAEDAQALMTRLPTGGAA
jgi:excisionase family DNA binding protein